MTKEDLINKMEITLIIRECQMYGSWKDIETGFVIYDISEAKDISRSKS